MFLKYRKYRLVLFFVFLILLFAGVAFAGLNRLGIKNSPQTVDNDIISKVIEKIDPTPSPTLPPTPQSHTIPQKLHVFQSFNNCGPATLSMALSYVGINITQQDLGQTLRPFQVPGGNNDDKSVTLEEVANQAKTYGLHSYLRPNGDIEKLEQLIANDIPIVARTWLKTNEDIGHYRVIRGYDKTTQQIIQDDSLQGKDLRYSYNEFLELWQPFNYEYLVIVNDAKKEIVERILGEELDENTAWENAETRIKNEMVQNPNNTHLIFALSRIYYYLGEYDKSVAEFNKVESLLSFRTLWYQIEPLKSIYETGDYNRVFQITDRILNNQNRAYSELYIIRGNIYEKQGKIIEARLEYEKAVQYNTNNATANDLLSKLN